MNKFMLSVCIILATSIIGSAQTGDDYKKNEFYVGFVGSVLDQDIADDKFAPGVQVSYVRNVNRALGLKADLSVVEKNERLLFPRQSFDLDPFDVPLRNRLRVTTVMGGLEIKNNSSESKVVPFGHALAGIGHIRIKPRTGEIQFPEFSETGFSAAFGGGIDIKMSRSITLRAVQADYNPIHIDGFTSHNVRVGIGIVIK